MKLGLHLPTMDWDGGPATLGDTLGRVVEAAEEAGFDTVTVADHVWQHPIMGGPIKNQVEAYTTLGFIAAHTSRVRLWHWPRRRLIDRPRSSPRWSPRSTSCPAAG